MCVLGVGGLLFLVSVCGMCELGDDGEVLGGGWV